MVKPEVHFMTLTRCIETHLSGLIGVIVFYLVILAVGLYAAWKNRKLREEAKENVTAEDVILAKRNINLFVGVMTMTGM